ncbi:polysaccharide pyruvyl transferase family protein [Akkermansiaceae bacterium]|nr:polysaccharide pyruvyl transferase family protein [Akkermansiaceae bacterium]
MKVGVLTFHKGINAGGFLQAKNLSSFLTALGHEVEIIDYVSEAQKKVDHDSIYRTKHPVRRWNNVRKLKRYKRAFQELRLGPKVKVANEISAQSYDMIVFGSDEIWNICNPFSGGDLIYFGEGISGVRKLSYAPSFGSTDLDHGGLSKLKPLLEDFETISVRDEHSSEIIKKILGQEPSIVVDPVLLSERDIPIGHPNSKGRIGLYLMSPTSDDVRRIKSFAARRNQETCSIGYHYSWADRNIATVQPDQVPGLLAGCSMVVTNTFHGVVFSLKNRVPFLIMDHPAKSQKIDTFRERLGLATVFKDNREISDDFVNSVDDQSEILDAWIASSKQLLATLF